MHVAARFDLTIRAVVVRLIGLHNQIVGSDLNVSLELKQTRGTVNVTNALHARGRDNKLPPEGIYAVTARHAVYREVVALRPILSEYGEARHQCDAECETSHEDPPFSLKATIRWPVAIKRNDTVYFRGRVAT